VIIPSALAFAFLGLSVYLNSLSVDLQLLLLVMWLVSASALCIGQQGVYVAAWGDTLALTCLITSMIVNALVTGLIVFRILEVFHQVKAATSDEKYLGATGVRKLHSVIFIILESGMTLFAIQLTRIVISTMNLEGARFCIVIHQMLNVIMSLLLFYSTDNPDLARV
jgi:hypothetical protein